MLAKLRVHKAVTMGANLHSFICNVLIDIVFAIYFTISYAQHKGFSLFNWTSTGGLKIDQSRKLVQQKLQETYIAESDFTF